jgi:replicative DNA helicase
MPPRTDNRRNTQRRDAAPERDVVEVAKLFDRPPPHSPEAEKGVLGSLLLDRRRIDDVALVLKADHFYSPGNRTIYEAILALHNANKTPEPMLLVERLRESGDLELIGGKETLLDIAESQPVAINAVHYAGIVRDNAVKRNLLAAASETIRDVFDLVGEEDDSVKQLVERTEHRIMAVSEDRVSDQVGDVSSTLVQLLDMIDSAGEKPRGIPTGYHDLDEQVRVLNGQLIIVAARPSLGKTAFATSLCENLSIGHGAKKGLFVTLEMSRLELVERMLSSLAQVPVHDLTSGHGLTLERRRRITEASSELSQMTLEIDDTPARTMSDIAAVCRRMKRDKRRGLDYVVIDYLQLIEPENVGGRENRETQVAAISKKLKRLARELQVPVFCLAQCNRQVADAKDQRPKLHHLRESGSVEQDADQVWFIHRDDYYATDEHDKIKCAGKAELIVAKQRSGWTGTIHLTFIKERTRFENRDHASQEIT